MFWISWKDCLWTTFSCQPFMIVSVGKNHSIQGRGHSQNSPCLRIDGYRIKKSSTVQLTKKKSERPIPASELLMVVRDEGYLKLSLCLHKAELLIMKFPPHCRSEPQVLFSYFMNKYSKNSWSNDKRIPIVITLCIIIFKVLRQQNINQKASYKMKKITQIIPSKELW